MYTVVNVWLSTENPGFGACFQLPFLPHTGSCGPPGYSPPVRFVLGVLLLAGLLLAGWGCWRLAARLLRPLSDMAATVGQLGPQNPG